MREQGLALEPVRAPGLARLEPVRALQPELGLRLALLRDVRQQRWQLLRRHE